MKYFHPVKFLKNTGKSFINLSGWLGTGQLKQTTNTLSSLSKPLFAKQSNNKEETFEEAMLRFGLTEDMLQQKSQRLLRDLKIYLFFELLLLLYMIFLLFNASLLATLVVLLLMALLACKIYKTHYYYYEIKQRKLGVSFKEWFQNTIRKGA